MSTQLPAGSDASAATSGTLWRRGADGIVIDGLALRAWTAVASIVISLALAL
jgi:hypothetical protein